MTAGVTSRGLSDVATDAVPSSVTIQISFSLFPPSKVEEPTDKDVWKVVANESALSASYATTCVPQTTPCLAPSSSLWYFFLLNGDFFLLDPPPSNRRPIIRRISAQSLLSENIRVASLLVGAREMGLFFPYTSRIFEQPYCYYCHCCCHLLFSNYYWSCDCFFFIVGVIFFFVHLFVLSLQYFSIEVAIPMGVARPLLVVVLVVLPTIWRDRLAINCW